MFSNLNAQSSTTFTTKFITHSVTYNGSDNPSQCWEAVASGIVIEDGTKTYFFSIPVHQIGELKKQIGDLEVIVEVGFYAEPAYDSNENGWVKKITLNGKIIFPLE